ncbi:MAG: hypothetical protein EGQ26_04000, partial [Clostridiales bacterium]|nr:hypothetical protein [Clostridiales bacterium]
MTALFDMLHRQIPIYIFHARMQKVPGKHLLSGDAACQKSLAEFAARRRQRDSDHFLSGRVPDRKYN